LIATSPPCTRSVEFLLPHPTDPTMIARYGVDQTRGGVYVEVEDGGLLLVSYEAVVTEQAIRDVLDDMTVFGFFSEDDVEGAVEWLSRPPCWRSDRPEGAGVRQVLRVVERLRMATGE
jgi:hypothetical protein